MNSLSDSLREIAYIENQFGHRSGPYRVTTGVDNAQLSIMVYEERLTIAKGAVLILSLSNGGDESFNIVDARFCSQLHSIPASWLLKLEKIFPSRTRKPW